jgi:hypothetical protein
MTIMCTLVVAACLTASPSARPPQDVARTLVFDKSLTSFISTANSRNRDPRLDWTTDGCSAPVVGSTGRTFDFYDACRRHDFAYRNFRTFQDGKLWTSSLRARIDAVFKKDMLADCARRAGASKASCVGWADTFYQFVRAYAGP